MNRVQLTQKTFDRFFIRQQDDYSCGPACLATIARLHNLPAEKDYAFFRERIGPCPDMGTHPHDITDVCQAELPTRSFGEGVYHGGIALAYILHQPTHIDHYVVFLARQDDRIIYYDPWDHALYNDKIQNIKWRSTFDWPYIEGDLKHWSVNFAVVEDLTFDFLADFAQPNPHRIRASEQENTKDQKKPDKHKA